MFTPPFILASASPARRQLLQAAGIEPFVHPSDFDESQVNLTDPAALVQTLAASKAEATLKLLWAQRDQLPAALTQLFFQRPGLILGCDSVLVINGEIHGKPANPEAAIARWHKMRGQVGELYTGHALVNTWTEADRLLPSLRLERHQVTRVWFADVSDRQIAAYVATGEPLNCAGCFALDGKGGLFVEKLEGCHTNVIGLSLPLLRQMLEEAGYDVADFWDEPNQPKG
jgi:septum formation protein